MLQVLGTHWPLHVPTVTQKCATFNVYVLVCISAKIITYVSGTVLGSGNT